MPGPKPLPLDRIWAKGVRAGDCLVWTGTTVRGYGVLTRSGRLYYVHRIAWELTHRPLVEGEVVLHLCDNPPCFEPLHLSVGSQADNLRDAATKARMSWGEGRTNRKVSLDDVREMRRLAADGMRSKELATRFPLSERTIRKILTGRNWRHDDAGHGST